MKIGLIGFGYWGKLLAQALASDPRVEQIYIVSRQAKLAQELREVFQFTNTKQRIVSMNTLLSLRLDGVVIATPEETHAKMLDALLTAGHACFVEKPFALTHSEAEALLLKAQHNKCVVMVDQVFSYDQGFRLLQQVVRQHLSTITHVVIQRTGLMSRQKKVSVIADTMPHDLYQLREGFGLEFESLELVQVHATRETPSSPIASSVVIAGNLKLPMSLHSKQTHVCKYHSNHSWSGQKKQRTFILGDTATDIWVKWSFTDMKDAEIQVWNTNKLIQVIPVAVLSTTPIHMMMSHWLDMLSLPWSVSRSQIESHWKGITHDCYWLERALELSSKDQHKRL